MEQYSAPSSVWLGPKLYVLTDNPDDVQILLNAPNSMYKDGVYRFMNCFDLNAAGLISSSGDTWKYHRKLLNPCFTPKNFGVVHTDFQQVRSDFDPQHQPFGGEG
jgi:cytochrome P450